MSVLWSLVMQVIKMLLRLDCRRDSPENCFKRAIGQINICQRLTTSYQWRFFKSSNKWQINLSWKVPLIMLVNLKMVFQWFSMFFICRNAMSWFAPKRKLTEHPLQPQRFHIYIGTIYIYYIYYTYWNNIYIIYIIYILE